MMSEDRKRRLATHLSILNREFLTDLREGVSGVSDPAVNLCSMMVVVVGGTSSAGLSNLCPGEACPTR